MRQMQTRLGMVGSSMLWLVSAAGAQVAQPVPYFNDFQSSVTAGWTSSRMSTTNALTKFLGDFGLNGSTQDSATLKLTVTAGKSHTLIFDFYGLRTPDGSSPTYGPDYFNVQVDGVQVFRESFDNQYFIDNGYGAAMQGTYPMCADQWGNLGFASSDGVFRKVTITFVPSSGTCNIKFLGGFSQAMGDEAWGIDNVRVVETESASTYLPRFADMSKSKTFQLKATASATDAAGVIWADVNNDGYSDCVVTGTAPRQYIYNGTTMKFAATTMVSSGNFYRQAAAGDFDNDGDTDFFGMTSDTAETCLLGQGTGTLVTAGALGFSAPATDENAVAADVNADGWLDLLMFSGNGNHLATNGGASLWASIVGSTTGKTDGVVAPGSGPSSRNATPFSSVTTPAGLNSVGAAGDGVYVASADVNDDGVPDFWYGFGGGRLFVSSPTGYVASTAISGDASNTNKVGAAFGDFDNDGKVDLFVPTYTVGQKGKLYRGLGNGTFVDVTSASGLDNTGGQRSSCWGDYDNDGYLDLYIVCRAGVGNALYRNNGNGTFTLMDDRSRAMGVDCLDACFADFDNDGDLDLAVSVNNAYSKIYENATNTISPTRNYLKVRFVGKGAGATNVQGVGQRVLLLDSTGKVIARRDLGGARGIGTEPVVAHFGGVDPTKRYYVKVFSKGKGYTTAVTPGTVTARIGANTFNQMVTITEADLRPPLRITSWTEDAQ